MKITETIERDCCQPQDLKTIDGSPRLWHDAEWKFCTACGAHHHLVAFTDAAGAPDRRWVKMPLPWGATDETATLSVSPPLPQDPPRRRDVAASMGRVRAVDDPRIRNPLGDEH